MNKPMTRSCIRIEREKQMVFLVKRLIRVRKVMCLRSTFAYAVSQLYACWDRDGGDKPPSHPYKSARCQMALRVLAVLGTSHPPVVQRHRLRSAPCNDQSRATTIAAGFCCPHSSTSHPSRLAPPAER